jgi:hypothetical protein
MKLKLLFVVPALLFISSVSADEVDQSSVTTFEDGSPAIADEVNTNFQALIDAINDNAAIASANAERLAALEANTESNSIAGNTYQLNAIGIINRADGENYGATSNLTQQYTVTFNSNGSFALSGTENDAELNTDVNELTLITLNDPVSLSGTWSQVGSSITTSEDLSFTVSADGNVLVLSEFEFGSLDDAQESESSLIVGIRTN